MDGHLWQVAADKEMWQHLKNSTWEKAIGSGWVFKVKWNSDRSIEHYKACLVAKGCTQHPGYDYVEVFSPTYCPSSLRAIVALATILNLHLCSIDITAAFINSNLDKLVYMHQAEGYKVGGKKWVYRLQHSLYGLKQAAHCWNQKLHSVFTEKMGFTCIETDNSVYIYSRGKTMIIAPIYINNITFACADPAVLDAVVAKLQTHFDLCNPGKQPSCLEWRLAMIGRSALAPSPRGSTSWTSWNALACRTATLSTLPLFLVLF